MKMTIVEALRERHRRRDAARPAVFCLGEDICDLPGGCGGAFTVTQDLEKEFGPDRMLNTPISESGSSGPPSAPP